MSLPDRHLGDRVAALVDGRVAPGERATLLDHVTRCRPCRIQYDEQRAIKGLLGDLRGIDAPDDLTLRLARLGAPSLADPDRPYLAPTVSTAPAARSGRTAGQRVRFAGASLLSVSVVGVGVAYAAGAAPAGLAVVPPVDRFVREHDHVAAGLPLSEPVLATTASQVAAVTPSASPTATPLPTAEATALTTPLTAVGLLRHAMSAESNLAFVGTETVQRAGVADQQLQVTHLPGRGAVVTTLGASGPTKAVFDADSGRWDDLVLGLLSGSYALAVQPDELVLGRPAHVVQAVRSDGSVAAQFRLDAVTGMLLGRAQYDRGGALIQSTEFTALSFTATTPNHLPPMMPSARAAALSTSDSTRWSSDGWPCPGELAGLTLVGASGLSGTGEQVLHLTYSDGLTVVSIFVQPGHLDDSVLDTNATTTVGDHPVRTAAAGGGGQQVFWSARGWVFTVVSDVSGSAVADVVAALPHDQGSTAAADVPDRLGRGAGRMLSWLNPLD